MAVTFETVQKILSNIAERGNVPLSSSPHSSFWDNYDNFVNNPRFFNKTTPLDSPFYQRLITQSMPLTGPYITDPGYVSGPEFQADLKSWLENGFPGPVEPGVPTPFVANWEGDKGKNNGVKDLFTAGDVSCMKSVSPSLNRPILLDEYDNVKQNATMIFGMVKNQRMPPGSPWNSHKLETFRDWMDAGCPQS